VSVENRAEGGRRVEDMMKCNYVQRSESNQTAEQTEENFAEKTMRECESERIFYMNFNETKRAIFKLFINDDFLSYVVNRYNRSNVSIYNVTLFNILYNYYLDNTEFIR